MAAAPGSPPGFGVVEVVMLLGGLRSPATVVVATGVDLAMMDSSAVAGGELRSSLPSSL